MTRSAHPAASCAFAGLAIAALAAGLAGCAVGKIASPFGDDAPEASIASGEEPLPADSGAPADAATAAIAAGNCPQLVAWPRDRYLTIYEIGQVGDSTAIRHRGEITKTARECEFGGGRVTVKYGISGRILLGPRGGSGRISLPLKVQVTDGSRNVIAQNTMQVSANVGAADPSGEFTVVREVSFRVAPGSRPGDYKVFVAFIRSAPGAG